MFVDLVFISYFHNQTSSMVPLKKCCSNEFEFGTSMYIWGASFERIRIIFYDIFIPEQTNTDMESTCFIYKKKKLLMMPFMHQPSNR